MAREDGTVFLEFNIEADTNCRIRAVAVSESVKRGRGVSTSGFFARAHKASTPAGNMMS